MKLNNIFLPLCGLCLSVQVIAQGTTSLEEQMQKKAREVISQMTVDEKISQMMRKKLMKL
mgnify:CR=1 FL=1